MICRWHEAKRKLGPCPMEREIEALQKHCDACPKPCGAQNDRTIITYSIDIEGWKKMAEGRL